MPMTAITQGDPKFLKGTPYDNHNLMLHTNGYCLRTKSKGQYMMYVYFDENRKLDAVVGAVLFD